MSAAARLRPRGPHDLLLRAALHPDPAVAAAARAEWMAGVDLDTLDIGSLHLLPLLAARGAPSAPDRLDRQVSRVARFTWLRTQALSQRLAEPLAALAAAGLRPMLSKGGALVYGHGLPARLRPMFDLDVVVPSHAILRAADVLEDVGFRPAIIDVRRHTARLLADTHAAEYVGPGSARVDLHWHPLHTARSDELDARFRAAAIPCEVAGRSVWATSLEDTLVITIAHASRWARTAPIRWVGDFALLLRERGDAIDWDAVAGRSREVRVSRTLLDALDYLRDVSGLEAPASARRALRAAPVPVAVRARRGAPDARDGGPRRAGRLGRLAEAYETDVASHAIPPGP